MAGIKIRKGKRSKENMVQLDKKHIKIFSVVIAAVFIGSVAAMAFTQMGSLTGGVASAASTAIGVIDYREAMSKHPGLEAANKTMEKEVESAQKDFEAKSADMDDNQKSEYYQQTQQRLAQKQADLVEPLTKQIEETVKQVAEQKGLSVVIDKGAVIYGGADITQDVIKKLK